MEDTTYQKNRDHLYKILETSIKGRYADFHLSNSFLRIDTGREILSYPEETKLAKEDLEKCLTILYSSQSKSDLEEKLQITPAEIENKHTLEKKIIEKLKEEKTLDFGVDTHENKKWNLPVVRLRVQTYLTSKGIGITARLLNQDIPSLGSLGYKQEHVTLFKELSLKRSGLILFTGATGNGKSTTLAALIDWIKTTQKKHIVTIEDPIEFIYADHIKEDKEHPSNGMVTQQEVGTHVQSYKKGLKDALRKHPHIILLGEIRDAETMEICMEAAQTGHIVISTLHTRSAARTLHRIKELFPEEKSNKILGLLADTLLLIVCQGLVPGEKEKTKELVYELLEIHDDSSKNAIRKFAEKESNVWDLLPRGKNQAWNHHLQRLLLEGRIKKETYVELKFSENDTKTETI